MRTYKVNENLRIYVRRVLLRHYYSCYIFQDTNGEWKCRTNASSDVFHKIVKEARAAKISSKKDIIWIDKSMFSKALFLDGLRSFQTDVILDEYL